MKVPPTYLQIVVGKGESDKGDLFWALIYGIEIRSGLTCFRWFCVFQPRSKGFRFQA